jgi:hypothetical protein
VTGEKMAFAFTDVTFATFPAERGDPSPGSGAILAGVRGPRLGSFHGDCAEIGVEAFKKIGHDLSSYLL